MGQQEGQVRPLEPEAAAVVGDALRVLIQGELDHLVDAAYERIEAKVRQFVMAAATRVVPENVAKAIDTVVSVRTCALDGRLRECEVRVDRLQSKLAAAKVLRFGPPGRKPSAEASPVAVAAARHLRANAGGSRRMSFRKVSARLAELGHKTPSGKPFSASAVRSMCKGPERGRRKARRKS